MLNQPALVLPSRFSRYRTLTRREDGRRLFVIPATSTEDAVGRIESLDTSGNLNDLD